jgi:hypothetical protein
MYKAVCRTKGSDDKWNPVTWGSLVYIAEYQQLQGMVAEMSKHFHLIEYKIIEDSDEP